MWAMGTDVLQTYTPPYILTPINYNDNVQPQDTLNFLEDNN